MTAATAESTAPEIRPAQTRLKLVALLVLLIAIVSLACFFVPEALPQPISEYSTIAKNWLGFSFVIALTLVALMAAGILMGRRISVDPDVALRIALAVPFSALVFDGIEVLSGGGSDTPLGGTLGRLIHNAVVQQFPGLSDTRYRMLFFIAGVLLLYQLVLSLLRDRRVQKHGSTSSIIDSGIVPSAGPEVETPRRPGIFRSGVQPLHDYGSVGLASIAGGLGLTLLYLLFVHASGDRASPISAPSRPANPTCVALREAEIEAAAIASRATSLRELIADVRELGIPELAREVSHCKISQRSVGEGIQTKASPGAQASATTALSVDASRERSTHWSGNFEKGPKRARPDRDYSSTKLDELSAGAQINVYKDNEGLRPSGFNAKFEALAHAKELAKWVHTSLVGSDGSRRRNTSWRSS